ncbi:hypothetical protein SESBI_09070 [Sesbania bispinosa]|nr:hypothetical protein SESBI_09070 [Sesbania bispinosa]
MKPSKRLKRKNPYLHKQKCDDADNKELNGDDDDGGVACEGANVYSLPPLTVAWCARVQMGIESRER